MSLYYEAAALLVNADRTGGSLRSRIYGKKDLKSAPAQVFALVVEATKWSSLLKGVIERAQILQEERKLTPALALLLTYDLLLSKNGVAAPANHVLKLAISRHKARLQAELARARLKLGLGSLEALRTHVQTLHGAADSANGEAPRQRHPRWVRVNTLKSGGPRRLKELFGGYAEVAALSDVMRSSALDDKYYIDKTIADLIALPPGHDVSALPAYKDGRLIVQDKASCFPAALLDPSAVEGDVIDATAAPGNKTTHLAALLKQCETRPTGGLKKVIAYERNAMRFKTLQKMVRTAGADGFSEVRHQDFLTVDPQSDEARDATAILLDPSCSGSGIIGRDDDLRLVLPDGAAATQSSTGKKRKRGTGDNGTSGVPTTLVEDTLDEQPLPSLGHESEAALEARLEALSAFQLKILLHAMSFPNCRRITYSTCSIHFAENENVVLRALDRCSEDGSSWRVLKRQDQPAGLRDWPLRGDNSRCLDAEVAEACIRCEKVTAEGTMGFFVAAFVRDPPAAAVTGDATGATKDTHDEWEGFDD